MQIKKNLINAMKNLISCEKNMFKSLNLLLYFSFYY
ncbi:hypothetical protein AB837_00238 [bacterium AB1]|nr:hypothetical protein AB837_00238 [bacterium AB1]